MTKDLDLIKIETMFKGFKGAGSSNSFPPITTLSKKLSQLAGDNKIGYVAVDSEVVKYYATASVEMWQRALHSFLISASTTHASPIWSSVSGYYSSHYIMRAFAHLYGYFQVFSKKIILELDLATKPFGINITGKSGSDGEHKLYWRIVHEIPRFNNDPFFYQNVEFSPPSGSRLDFRSDAGHRNRANYADHVGHFPVFRPLDDNALQTRIHRLSSMEINDPQIPNVDRFPDIDNVQLIAYHRILKYRAFLDHILSTSNQFWTVQRNPSWKPAYFDFQGVGAGTIELLAGLVH